MLNERTHNLQKPKELKRGNVVLLIKERRNRLACTLAPIVDTFPSRDGRVRSAMLKREIHLKDKDTKPNYMHKLVKRGV